MGIAAELARAIDPVELARAAAIEPDAWQARLLRSPSSRILLNCSRQSGKSTMVALLAVHAAVYQPGSLILLLSPTLRQSGELFRKCLSLYRAVGRPVAAEAESTLFLTLGNHSRIVSLPGKDATVRGYSGVDVLAIDAAARVSDDLYAAVRPTLAISGGRLLALSTPYGNRGFFYEAWSGSEPWERYRVPATDCPRISADFLDEERRTLGPWWFGQEYGCDFLDAQTAAFSFADIQAAFEGADEGLAWSL